MILAGNSFCWLLPGWYINIYVKGTQPLLSFWQKNLCPWHLVMLTLFIMHRYFQIWSVQYVEWFIDRLVITFFFRDYWQTIILMLLSLDVHMLLHFKISALTLSLCCACWYSDMRPNQRPSFIVIMFGTQIQALYVLHHIHINNWFIASQSCKQKLIFYFVIPIPLQESMHCTTIMYCSSHNTHFTLWQNNFCIILHLPYYKSCKTRHYKLNDPLICM